MNAPAIMSPDLCDVPAQQIRSVFRSRNGLKPCGHLVVPAEIMSSYLLIVLGGERHQSIRMSEVVAVRFRMNQQPFHVVLGYEDARLLPQKRGVIRALKLPKGNCTPDQEIFLSSCRPKRLGRGGVTRRNGRCGAHKFCKSTP